ncbi:DUF1667 domain-containing protein [Acidaminobacter sp. JC074]|uniref:DUF1667 domain-containing protein n=1 Tax=Acidaminobacter sp. JC074 TaxID=2530199 RepID=UPI001F0D5759|nr:DUF1667 domain-containing protein [Acidaminobacter sp. JC074]MCH4886503.1 DUF1667 domain-containing protein [Acidaminobacter sp. JC074]
MSKVHDLICIACPVGCHLKVTEGSEILVEHAKCKRGEAYGVKELTNPTRIVTSTMKIEGGLSSRIPVRTAEDIPKDKIFDCMKEINETTLTAPVKMGDVLIENVLGTGVNIVASRSMKAI